MSITIRLTENEEWMDFDIPTAWEDMTLEYWAGLAMIIKSHQDADNLKRNSIKDKNKGNNDIEDILKDATFIDELRLNRDIFCYMSGLDKEDIKKVDANKITEVINTIGVLTEEYEPKGIKSFDLDGDEYSFPSEFLKNNTFGDYIESTQLDMTIESMKNGRYDVLPEQMAILCRREGESYDEDLIPEKTERFKKLKMDTIYEFAFFLTNQSLILNRNLSMYSEKKGNL